MLAALALYGAPALAQSHTFRDGTALVAAALYEHPALAAADAQRDAALDRAAAERAARPQPRLQYSYAVRPAETRQGPQTHTVAWQHPFAWPGTLPQADDAALAEADAARDMGAATRLGIERDVARAALEVTRIDAVDALLAEQGAVWNDVLMHVERTQAFTDATWADVARLTVQAELIADRRAALAADRERWRQQLVADTGVPDIDVALDPADPWLAPAGDLPACASPVDAVAAHPALAATADRARAAVEAAESAALGVRPTPAITVQWGIVERYPPGERMVDPSGADIVSVGLMLPIPWYRATYTARADAWLDTADALAAQQLDAQRAMAAELAGACARYDDARARVERYDVTLLPLAEDALQTMTVELEHGEREHVDVLLAFQQQLDLRVARLDAVFAARIERVAVAALAPEAP